MRKPQNDPFKTLEGKDLTRVPMMQVIEEDTHDNYVVCQGYDPDYDKFFEKLSVAKPYGERGQTGIYKIAEVYPAVKPITILGTTPGVASESTGHPADLEERVDKLTDDNGIDVQWMFIGGGSGSSSKFRVAKVGGTSVSYPTKDQADGYAASLTTIEGNLDAAAGNLDPDPGFAGIADAIGSIADGTQLMMDSPDAVAASIAGQVDSLQSFQDAAQAQIDAHYENIEDGGDGTLTNDQKSYYNSIISYCTSFVSSLKSIATALAAYGAGQGNAAIWARNDYGVLVATGETVTVYCELLADGESISGFVYIARSADDSEYRVVAVSCADFTQA